MDRGTGAVLVVGAIVVAVVIAAVLGVFGVRTETSVPDGTGVTLEIPTDGSAIVFRKSQGGGLKLLGVRIQRPDYTIDVALTVPAGCIEDDGAGERTLRSDGDCASLPVSGPIGGGGRNSTGETTVILRFAVSEECHEASALGSSWPSTEPACAGF